MDRQKAMLWASVALRDLTQKRNKSAAAVINLCPGERLVRDAVEVQSEGVQPLHEGLGSLPRGPEQEWCPQR